MIIKRLIKIVLIFVLMNFLVIEFLLAQKFPYQIPRNEVELRVQDLLSRMTLEEKVAQMCQYVGPEHIRLSEARMNGKKINKNDDAQGFYPELTVDSLLQMTEKGLVGSFLHVVTASEGNMLQKLAMKSRLQIPLLIGIDAIHGNALVNGATVYPSPITMASGFDTVLVKKCAEQTASEMRATGSQWTFMPNLDVARDPRWGRTGETFGEDPYLVSRMGVAMIKGFQGDGKQMKNNVLACMKHLIAGSQPVNGTNAAPTDISERTLREVFLPPYLAAIREGNVKTAMAAHNELNGIPCHGDKWLMDDIIRKEMKFDGFIVSDWMDIERMYDMHHYTSSMVYAYFESVQAGIDMHMHGPGFMEGVLQLVRDGRISEDRINQACTLILDSKFRLGLFENPYVDEKLAQKMLFTEDHRNTALKMAEGSIVLLKNENNILPLNLSKYKRIFISGPNADNQSILGDWALQQPDENVITILEGLQSVTNKDQLVFYNYGSDVRSQDLQKINEAKNLVSGCDLAIIVVGENPLRYQQKLKTSGENIDRMAIDLIGIQQQLIDSIESTGMPVIVVLVGGRPLAVEKIASSADALIQAWEPGSFGGTALAGILTGKVNPSGKLPVSMPRHSGQIQLIYNHKPSQYFHPYIDGPSTPLYPFGYGLSYTSFNITSPKVDKTVFTTGENILLKVNITNTGSISGTEVVQLYIRDLFSSATRPVKEMKDFSKVELNPGETKEITFTITPDKLAFYDKNMHYGVEPGTFELMVGSSSDDKDLKKITIEVVK